MSQNDKPKDPNPKDAAATTRVPYSLIPRQPLAEVAIALLEGAVKYGKFNWRGSKVVATVYTDAIERHLSAWLNGQDNDSLPDVSHLAKICAGCLILMDAQQQKTLIDDRPKGIDPSFLLGYNEKVGRLLERLQDDSSSSRGQSVGLAVQDPEPDLHVMRKSLDDYKDGEFIPAKDLTARELHTIISNDDWKTDPNACPKEIDKELAKRLLAENRKMDREISPHDPPALDSVHPRRDDTP